ncbi:hypothetical protein GQ55_9G050300 [Panicum hallii var. hallii]|uniref:Uncharacterized protein n=1 Tax=Panicum hallii var. hallii TaxID=1504633 RepID=A0A2T7BZT7_9POAL|nr:hypothetical protein GQ55_9G050300 [Panicum hallii var. hallii]
MAAACCSWCPCPRRSRRGSRAGGRRCRLVRGCGMLAEVRCRAGVRALGAVRRRTGRRQPAGSARPPRDQRKPTPVAPRESKGVGGGASCGGGALGRWARGRKHGRTGWARGGTGGVWRA